MKAICYTENGYTFVNRNVQKTLCLPTFVIEPYIIIDPSIDVEKIKKLIATHGGFITYDDILGKNHKYSIKAYKSICQFYIGKDFAAVVYKPASKCTITKCYSGETKPKYLLSEVMPNRWLNTPFNEMIGRPCETWSGLGDKFFQVLDIDTLSGIEANCYAFQGQELIAAVQVKSMNIPWLYYPKTTEGAKGLIATIRGAATYKGTIAGLNFTTEDLGDDGILFTEFTSIKAKELRSIIASCTQLPDLTWCKKLKAPQCSSKKYFGILQFLSYYNELSKETISSSEGLVFYGDDCIERLDTSVLNCILNNSTLLEYASGIMIPSRINEILNDFNEAYTNALNEALDAGWAIADAAQKAFLDEAYAKCPIIAGEEVMKEVKQVVTQETKIPMDQINAFCGLKVDLPQQVVYGMDTISEKMAALRRIVLTMGKDFKDNNALKIYFGPECEKSVRLAARECVAPIIADMCVDVKNFISRLYTANYYSNDEVNYRANCKDHSNDYFNKRAWSIDEVKANTRITKVSIVIADEKQIGIASVGFNVEMGFIEARWAHNTDINRAKEVYRNCLSDAIADLGFSVDPIGPTTKTFSDYWLPLWPRTNHKSWTVGWNWNKQGKGRGASWKPNYRWLFNISKKYQLVTDRYRPDFSGESNNVQKVLDQMQHEAFANALPILQAALDEILQTNVGNPIVSIAGELTNPATARQFFECPLVDNEALINGLRLFEQLHPEDRENTEKLKELLYLMSSKIQSAVPPLEKVYWVDRDDLFTSPLIYDANLAPIYCAFS